jgi:hypothetical protein
MSETSVGLDDTRVRYVGSDEDTINLTDQVAGDRVETEPAEAPSLFITARFGGGDPTLCRMRDVSITIPIQHSDMVDDVTALIAGTLRELSKLGNIASLETNLVGDAS